MAAGYQDQYLEQGATFTSQLTLVDQDGSSYDLNGFTISSQARRSYRSANAEITFDTEIVNANAGIILLSAAANTTANVWPGPTNKLVYDVIITQTSTGLVSRVLEGHIYVSPGVTR